MIQMYTYLDVADNTGAKECMCIKVLGGTRRRYAGLGDVIIASVKKAIPGGDVKPGDVVRGVIVRCRKATRREDGSYVRFDRNALVLIDTSNVLLYCSTCRRGVRIGHRYTDDGRKERFCKKCGNNLGMLSKARPAYARKTS